MGLVLIPFPIIDWLSSFSTASGAITDLSQHEFECAAFSVKPAHRVKAGMPIYVYMGQRYPGNAQRYERTLLAGPQRALGREWVRHPGANRREIVLPAFPPEAQLERELMRKTIAPARVAVRTKMFAGLASALDAGIREEENLTIAGEQGLG